MAAFSHSSATIFLLLWAAVLFSCANAAPAPLAEGDLANSQALEHSEAGASRCYYNFQHYEEGDRIVTNEPCLNCTCHKRMLMCYLRVCPFTKAIGQDCTIEKKPDQCCPVITCPEVPVDILSSSTTPATATTPSSAVGSLNNYGCTLEDNTFYPDGVQMPADPKKPCELCYCIRNHTTCVRQECTLNVEGCRPVYQEGVCCPVRYDCDDYKIGTTERPSTGGLLLGSTPSPLQCRYGDTMYNDGELIESSQNKPCESCYCMRGDIVCAVRSCGEPMEGKDCEAIPPPEGECCPTTYQCANETIPIDPLATESSIIMHTPGAQEGEAEKEPESDGSVSNSHDSSTDHEEPKPEVEVSPSDSTNEEEKVVDDKTAQVDDKIEDQSPVADGNVELDPTEVDEIDEEDESAASIPTADKTEISTEHSTDLNENKPTSAPASVSFSESDSAHDTAHDDSKTVEESSPGVDDKLGEGETEPSVTVPDSKKEDENKIPAEPENKPIEGEQEVEESENASETTEQSTTSHDSKPEAAHVDDSTQTESETAYPETEHNEGQTESPNHTSNEITGSEPSKAEDKIENVLPTVNTDEEKQDSVNTEDGKDHLESTDESKPELHDSVAEASEENENKNEDSVQTVEVDKKDGETTNKIENESVTQTHSEPDENNILLQENAAPESPETLDQVKETVTNEKESSNSVEPPVQVGDEVQVGEETSEDNEPTPVSNETQKDDGDDAEDSHTTSETSITNGGENSVKEPIPPRKEDSAPEEIDRPQHPEGSMTKAEDAPPTDFAETEVTTPVDGESNDKNENLTDEVSQNDNTAIPTPDSDTLEPVNPDVGNEDDKKPQDEEVSPQAEVTQEVETSPSSEIPAETPQGEGQNESVDSVNSDPQINTSSGTQASSDGDDSGQVDSITEQTKPEEITNESDTNLNKEVSTSSEIEVPNIVVMEPEENHDSQIKPDEQAPSNDPIVSGDNVDDYNTQTELSEATTVSNQKEPSAEVEPSDVNPTVEETDHVSSEDSKPSGAHDTSLVDDRITSTNEETSTNNDILINENSDTDTNSVHDSSDNAEDGTLQNEGTSLPAVVEVDTTEKSEGNVNKDDNAEQNKTQDESNPELPVSQDNAENGPQTESSTVKESATDSSPDVNENMHHETEKSEENTTPSEIKPELQPEGHIPTESHETDKTTNEEDTETNEFPEIVHDPVESDSNDFEEQQAGVHEHFEHDSPSNNEIADDNHHGIGGSSLQEIPAALPGPVGVIPGEGDCLVDGKTYSNNSQIPSKSPCHKSCSCMSSIVHCQGIDCPPPPPQLANCMPVHQGDLCCPVYTCDGEAVLIPESHNQMGVAGESPEPSVENNAEPQRPQDEASSSEDKVADEENPEQTTGGEVDGSAKPVHVTEDDKTNQEESNPVTDENTESQKHDKIEDEKETANTGAEDAIVNENTENPTEQSNPSETLNKTPSEVDNVDKDESPTETQPSPTEGSDSNEKEPSEVSNSSVTEEEKESKPEHDQEDKTDTAVTNEDSTPEVKPEQETTSSSDGGTEVPQLHSESETKPESENPDSEDNTTNVHQDSNTSEIENSPDSETELNTQSTLDGVEQPQTPTVSNETSEISTNDGSLLNTEDTPQTHDKEPQTNELLSDNEAGNISSDPHEELDHVDIETVTTEKTSDGSETPENNQNELSGDKQTIEEGTNLDDNSTNNSDDQSIVDEKEQTTDKIHTDLPATEEDGTYHDLPKEPEIQSSSEDKPDEPSTVSEVNVDDGLIKGESESSQQPDEKAPEVVVDESEHSTEPQKQDNSGEEKVPLTVEAEENTVGDVEANTETQNESDTEVDNAEPEEGNTNTGDETEPSTESQKLSDHEEEKVPLTDDVNQITNDQSEVITESHNEDTAEKENVPLTDEADHNTVGESEFNTETQKEGSTDEDKAPLSAAEEDASATAENRPESTQSTVTENDQSVPSNQQTVEESKEVNKDNTEQVIQSTETTITGTQSEEGEENAIGGNNFEVGETQSSSGVNGIENDPSHVEQAEKDTEQVHEISTEGFSVEGDHVTDGHTEGVKDTEESLVTEGYNNEEHDDGSNNRVGDSDSEKVPSTQEHEINKEHESDDIPSTPGSSTPEVEGTKPESDQNEDGSIGSEPNSQANIETGKPTVTPEDEKVEGTSEHTELEVDNVVHEQDSPVKEPEQAGPDTETANLKPEITSDGTPEQPTESDDSSNKPSPDDISGQEDEQSNTQETVHDKIDSQDHPEEKPDQVDETGNEEQTHNEQIPVQEEGNEEKPQTVDAITVHEGDNSSHDNQKPNQEDGEVSQDSLKPIVTSESESGVDKPVDSPTGDEEPIIFEDGEKPNLESESHVSEGEDAQVDEADTENKIGSGQKPDIPQAPVVPPDNSEESAHSSPEPETTNHEADSTPIPAQADEKPDTATENGQNTNEPDHQVNESLEQEPEVNLHEKVPELPSEETEHEPETTSHVDEDKTSEHPAPIAPESTQPAEEEPKPETDPEIPTDDQFPSGGDMDYDVSEDGAFGPGTCRYGGKVYVSAQQIPRDDPCDFCFCFRSDIICLQQSCPPPIHRCHQEPIQGYCCPRYQCPVSMATSLNLTTTTTTTTTTLPPHFFAHAYHGAARQAGCLHRGRAYSVGEEITTASGPCLRCICGSDGQMKCDPVVCSPEPMLRKMMEAAVSHRRR